ncbi:NifU N-terminal domain-containing protein [Fictibacillus enclensis]|uniref:Scaffolding protein n=1 Tax=Fictibacillus enclensis TaxID=1017270 RepID=A0A0V8JDU4_9BACL|nr:MULTISPECIES: NifU N-terminal domain-containing protein [Fictibacillus]KSU84816.1 scaffolding protein [Fictibacillus enclensis]MDM5337786.1 NifU N-terminal domain-containing protein [Fictibacillus enclensis]RXY99528.1 scaffolding protein [Fictibacillus sp. S7]WHY74149.1 NifU N-terminal domain-containing protein [Fictibacillus enclensis]SCB86249.1 Scaffold protein Nfu/NifU N terminal [Fictibacillus enclensis]
MALEFAIEPTPNPNALKFSASQPFLEGRLSARAGDNSDSPLAASLLAIDGVESIFGFQDFLTVNKFAEADWETLVPHIKEVLETL